jgi:hypothetical protein
VLFADARTTEAVSARGPSVPTLSWKGSQANSEKDDLRVCDTARQSLCRTGRERLMSTFAQQIGRSVVMIHDRQRCFESKLSSFQFEIIRFKATLRRDQ